MDAFGVTWAVALASLLLYLGFVGLGDLMRKLYVILETEQERMDFFLQVSEGGAEEGRGGGCTSWPWMDWTSPVSLADACPTPILLRQIRCWMRYLVLVALNLAYLPILGKLFKTIYRYQHYKHDPHHAHEAKLAPYATAIALAAVYGVGFPVVVYGLMQRRRRLHAWVADPSSPEGGHYEVRPELALAQAQGGGGGKASKGKGTDASDDDLTAYNFLELEQQVSRASLRFALELAAFFFSNRHSSHSRPLSLYMSHT